MAETTAMVKHGTISQELQSEQFRNNLALVLPAHVKPDRLARIALFSIRQNPKLQECSRDSLMAAIGQCAMLGVEPGIRNEAYIIPYGGQAQFQIGYQGLTKLARQSGEINQIVPFIIYENDQVEIDLANEKIVTKHIPWYQLGKREPGAIRSAYVRAFFKDGTVYTHPPMPLQEIHKNHRDRSSGWQAYKKGKISTHPWATDEEAMIKKTVIKDACKFLPASVEDMRKALDIDGRSWAKMNKETFESPLETAESNDYLTDEQRDEVEEKSEPPKAGKEAVDYQEEFKAAYLASGRPSSQTDPKMFVAFLKAESLTLKDYKENKITEDKYKTMIAKLKAEKNPQAPDEIDADEAGIEDAEVTIKCAFTGCKATVPAHVAELSWEKFKANYCEEHYNQVALEKEGKS